MLAIRESFAAKILSALVGTVGVLLVMTFLVVQAETARQVALVSEQAVRSAETYFQRLEAYQERETNRAARLLAEGRRTLAELDAAIDASDRSYLAGHVAYELDLADIPDMVVAFTDARGRPVLTLHHDVPVEEADPVDIGGVAVALLEGTDFELRAYRVFDGALFSLRTRVIEMAGRPIGTITFGLPVTAADIEEIGGSAGVELCLVLAGSCVVGTPRGQGALASVLASARGTAEVMSADADGEPWSVTARPLIEGDPELGWRVVAVPLAQVHEPFDRIQGALFVGGGASLVLALLLGTVLSRGLSRPIRSLVSATGRVAQGDFETEVSVASHDEIGTLAEAFNDMTHGLLVKERVRSVLDKVVSRDVAEELLQGGVELGGENRHVTVLFADIRGFTPLTEGMEPQQVIGLLNQCMQRLTDAVQAEGGVVDKYVGDELMAVFGAPVSDANHALHATRAGVRMQRALSEWNVERAARGEASLGLGVGINSGVAVAGNMGSRDRLNYTVLGDAVNMASRLCSEAGAGVILATDATLQEAGPAVRRESLGGRMLKGFSTEMEVFEVLGMDGVTGSEPEADDPHAATGESGE